MNVLKSKILIFRAGGLLPRNLLFSHEGEFSEAQNTLAGQAQKAIFKLNKYLNISVLVKCGIKPKQLNECTCSFVKTILGVKKNTHKMILYMAK